MGSSVGLQLWQWVVMTVGLGVTAVGAYFLARWSWRWLVALVAIALLVVFVTVVPGKYPAHAFLDEATPALLLNHFWAWVLVFVLTLAFTAIALVRTAVLGRAGEARAVDGGGAEGFPDLDAAWKEIAVRLSHARIDLAAQNVFLLLAPQEEWAAALIHSAGLQLFVQAPEGAAPVHAYATADGVFLSVAGASAFGTQDESGTRRLESVCRRLLAERPDCPLVRGVVVLLPITWAGQPDSVKWAAALRDDLRTIERTLKVRCPVFALFPQMETTPGFAEFTARMPPALRQGRCGFAVPATHPFTGDLVQNGLVWMAGWFHGWILNLMADDLFNHAGNHRLFTLDSEFRRYRKRLRAVMESALSTHRESEPVLFRGCYFLASGATAPEQAFTAGLLRGPRGRILADHTATQWTREAREDDRFYRRAAWGVGLLGAALTAAAWAAILATVESRLWWAGPVTLAVAWVVALLRISRW